MNNKKIFEKFEKKNSGSLAGTLTSLAFLPQVIQVYKTKSAKGLSLSSLVIFFFRSDFLAYTWFYILKIIQLYFFALITGMLYMFLIYAKLKYY